jgi:hypothetical protein
MRSDASSFGTQPVAAIDTPKNQFPERLLSASHDKGHYFRDWPETEGGGHWGSNGP